MEFLAFGADESDIHHEVMGLINNSKTKTQFPWDEEGELAEDTSVPFLNGERPTEEVTVASDVNLLSSSLRLETSGKISVNNNVAHLVPSNLNVNAAEFKPGSKFIYRPPVNPDPPLHVEVPPHLGLNSTVHQPQAPIRILAKPDVMGQSQNADVVAESKPIIAAQVAPAPVVPAIKTVSPQKQANGHVTISSQHVHTTEPKRVEDSVVEPMIEFGWDGSTMLSDTDLNFDSEDKKTSVIEASGVNEKTGPSTATDAAPMGKSESSEPVIQAAMTQATKKVDATKEKVKPSVVSKNIEEATPPRQAPVSAAVITNGSSTHSVPTSPESSSATATPPPPPKSSWASLFTPKQPAAPPNNCTEPVTPELKVEEEKKRPINEVGDVLSKLVINSTATPIQARGLINQANWCYINSTLQALIACPPFYQLLRALPKYPALSRGRSVTPVLDAMVEFANQFVEIAPQPRQPKEKGGRKRQLELQKGPLFEPTSIYKVLPVLKTDADTFQHGKQEDAEEFLACLLNTLHEEMCAAITANDEDEDDGKEGDSPDPSNQEWEQVGPRNKSVVTQSNVGVVSTPISLIFGGKFRSTLYTTKESATLEPFFTVPLNVQTCKSIPEALQAFVSKETIDGYNCPQSKKQLDAWRRLMFDELPRILILHLKCFVYDKGGSKKVMHDCFFSEKLVFEKDLLSHQARAKHSQPNQRTYKLFAVVYHSGERTTGGHYHTNVFHTGVQSWVKFDDYGISILGQNDVFKSQPPCVPYLLYYKKVDTGPPQGTNRPPP